ELLSAGEVPLENRTEVLSLDAHRISKAAAILDCEMLTLAVLFAGVVALGRQGHDADGLAIPRDFVQLRPGNLQSPGQLFLRGLAPELDLEGARGIMKFVGSNPCQSRHPVP